MGNLLDHQTMGRVRASTAVALAASGMLMGCPPPSEPVHPTPPVAPSGTIRGTPPDWLDEGYLGVPLNSRFEPIGPRQSLPIATTPGNGGFVLDARSYSNSSDLRADAELWKLAQASGRDGESYVYEVRQSYKDDRVVSLMSAPPPMPQGAEYYAVRIHYGWSVNTACRTSKQSSSLSASARLPEIPLGAGFQYVDGSADRQCAANVHGIDPNVRGFFATNVDELAQNSQLGRAERVLVEYVRLSAGPTAPRVLGIVINLDSIAVRRDNKFWGSPEWSLSARCQSGERPSMAANATPWRGTVNENAHILYPWHARISLDVIENEQVVCTVFGRSSSGKPVPPATVAFRVSTRVLRQSGLLVGRDAGTDYAVGYYVDVERAQ